MTEISFYHLKAMQLERALPKLLEKIISTGQRTVLMTPTLAQLETFNDLLWTYSTKVFLPHGTKKDGFIEKQPIYLTCEEENPNQASILCITYGLTPNFLSSFQKCIDIFNGNDENELANARSRMAKYSSRGHFVNYWQQTDDGSWSKGTIDK